MVSDSSTSALEPLPSSNFSYVIRHLRCFCNSFPCFNKYIRASVFRQRSSTVFSFVRGEFNVAIVTFGLQCKVGMYDLIYFYAQTEK